MGGSAGLLCARAGFTIVELLAVMLVISILAGIALPAYEQFRLRARAAAVVGDMRAVQLAALTYNADTGQWPADGYPGELPEELAPYLPGGFSFDREGYRLDWEYWRLPDGTPKHPETSVLLGISVTPDEPALGAALEGLVGPGTVRYTLGENYTFILESM